MQLRLNNLSSAGDVAHGDTHLIVIVEIFLARAPPACWASLALAAP